MKKQKTNWGQLTTIEETPEYRLEKIEIKSGNVYAGQNAHNMMLCTILSGSVRVLMNNNSELYHTCQVVRIPESMNFQLENAFYETCVFYTVSFLK